MDKLTKIRNLVADLATLSPGEKVVVQQLLVELGHPAVAKMLQGEPTIVEATVTLPSGWGQQAKVSAKLSDGTETDVFRYYSDELHFSSEEFKGLTLEQAHALRQKRDIAYLQSR